jgi:isoleucyl-tRNA synthetase
MLSPLIPLYAEEAWHYTPLALKREDSVYKLGWFQPKPEWNQGQLAADMKLLEPLKESILKLLEDARKDKYISSSLHLISG